MAADVVMPALGMAQETGTLIRWLKREGESVAKGEPVMEVETDKATVEIESPASGILSHVRAHEGEEVPVGQVIAVILSPGEATAPKSASKHEVSPVAQRMAEEQGVDLALVKPTGGRIRKEDVLAYLEQSSVAKERPSAVVTALASGNGAARRIPASPKARRLAAERGVDLSTLTGSGPGGAVLAQDVPAQAVAPAAPSAPIAAPPSADVESMSSAWRVMASRMTQSWTSAPHFYLAREVRAAALVEMRSRLTQTFARRGSIKLTYTDLLVKIAAMTLREHPRLNASWSESGIQTHLDINIGLAVGIDDGLVVPVIHTADRLSLGEIAALRADLIQRTGDHRLRPADLSDGSFTISNLGMYNVDAFMAVVNPPQAAILAVGRIAERVVPENGQPVVRPTFVLTLSVDHRVADGLRAAKFLDDLVILIEEPWGLLA
jgi:pyruvate dehydrogenase E2 component (dihydrolipoamide acetyltransferase)